MSPRRRVIFGLLSLLWPLRAALDATRGVVRYGARVGEMSGLSRGRQWRDAMCFALFWNYSPRTYFQYRFWDPAIHNQATSFLQIHEMVVLEMLLDSRKTDLAKDKWDFGARCASAGIPTPQAVARFGPDDEEWLETPGVLPRVDLFAKPVGGMQGIGGERWIHEEGRWSRKGQTLTEMEFIEHCRRRGRSFPIILQRCLANHPDLARYSSGPLCTFRVMTYGAGTRAAVLGVTFKIARQGSDVDNIHAGGIAVPVDQVAGRLGAGIGKDPTEAPFRVHPDSGEPIEGEFLAIHPQVVDLALAAHRELDVPWSIGWDIAMTSEGPIVVEGNPWWGIDLFHLPHGRGLPGDFADALLRQVKAKSSAASERPEVGGAA